MKRKLLSMFFVMLLIGTVFTMISLGKLESGAEIIFEEDFNDLDNWYLIVYDKAGGSANDPEPQLDYEMGLPAPSLDVNGDGSCGDGAYSKNTFDYANGLIIEFDMYVASGYDWNWGRGGLSDHMPNLDHKRTDGAYVDPTRCDPSFVVGIGLNDDGDYNRRPPSLGFGIKAEDGSWDGYIYDSDASEYENEWHHYKIEIEKSGYVNFYIDGDFAWRTNKRIDKTLTPMPLLFGTRDAYGPVRIDNIQVMSEEKSASSFWPQHNHDQTNSRYSPSTVENFLKWSSIRPDPDFKDFAFYGSYCNWGSPLIVNSKIIFTVDGWGSKQVADKIAKRIAESILLGTLYVVCPTLIPSSLKTAKEIADFLETLLEIDQCHIGMIYCYDLNSHSLIWKSLVIKELGKSLDMIADNTHVYVKIDSAFKEGDGIAKIDIQSGKTVGYWNISKWIKEQKLYDLEISDESFLSMNNEYLFVPGYRHYPLNLLTDLYIFKIKKETFTIDNVDVDYYSKPLTNLFSTGVKCKPVIVE